MSIQILYPDNYFSGFDCANLAQWEVELCSGVLIIRRLGYHDAHLAGIRAEIKLREDWPERREPMDPKYEPRH